MEQQSVVEIWKDISGYENLYQISNKGQVKSLKKTIDKGKWGIVIAVNLYRDKKPTMISVHVLVAKEFVDNPDPINKTQVNHEDGNKLNNNDWNLGWTTPLENTTHAIENGLFCEPPRGEKNGQSVLTEDNVRYIRNTRYTVSRKELASKFGVSIKHIDRVRCGERWGHVI